MRVAFALQIWVESERVVGAPTQNPSPPKSPLSAPAVIGSLRQLIELNMCRGLQFNYFNTVQS